MNLDTIEDVSDAEIAFGTMKGLPEYDKIPKEFRRSTRFNEFFSHVFYKGSEDIEITFKDGVDPAKFARWFRAHATSWGPKHEHKEAGIAYRISHWIVDWKYTPDDKVEK
jgi:hypothetical protein